MWSEGLGRSFEIHHVTSGVSIKLILGSVQLLQRDLHKVVVQFV